MKRRRTSAMALAVAALVTGTGATSPTPKATPSPTPTATQSDGTLQILTYRGYAEYGGVSPKANWVGSFEKETGCRIARLDTVRTAEEMAAKVGERPYDVISAGPVLAGDLIARKQVQPVDPAKVAGYDDLDERFREMGEVSGKVYGVPYLWGYHEFVYDAAKVKGASLDRAFASDRVALRDSPMTIADAALTDNTVKDPYELSRAQFDRAVALLGQHKDRTYWKKPIDLVKGFATGSLDYAQATPYYRLLLEKAGKPVKAVAAKKTTGWLDSWMLGANLPDTTCAYRWLTWMTSADAQRDAASWVGLAPANDKACKGRGKSICDVYGVGDAKRLARVAFAVRPPGDCRGEDGECTDYAVWAKQWDALAG
ncbi:extracellular solute-binding protein [Nonomuraea spiralis]|uniref:Extracellular solute-binding protein n=1 Tax=Nonomuraea spiralis TaxID=46182 RepID=A0ABV5IKS5_9ACTN|nr:extracellular solute-binding protein [Nonomuraea spiralis]GGT36397.1 spermidine/putrescine ABC transporter substrate-binding protein [Nonomuraea spiralis]